MAVTLLIEPQDTWFFRTARPFGAAESAASTGEAELLPAPAVVFGALRTGLGNHWGVDWQHGYKPHWQAWLENGTQANLPAVDAVRRLGPPHLPGGRTWPSDSLSLGGYMLAQLDRWGTPTPLFPLPAAVLTDKNKGGVPLRDDLRLALPVLAHQGLFSGSAASLAPVMPPPDPQFIGEHRPLFVTLDDFGRLLSGLDPQGGFDKPLIAPEMVAVTETRIGIARDPHRRAVLSGHLYQLLMHRWRSRSFTDGGEHSYGLMARLHGIDESAIPSPFALYLGGERRLAWARVAQTGEWITDAEQAKVRQAMKQSTGWWMALATPAHFTQGWHPSWITKDATGKYVAKSLDQEHPDAIMGHLCGFTAPTPAYRSGWDYASRSPKAASLNMLPGTTWFFSWPAPVNEVLIDQILALQGRCIADDSPHGGQGLAFIGAWTAPRS